eukprot:scaffold84800_cov66-Phaeocystis_antarctica.AAC.4
MPGSSSRLVKQILVWMKRHTREPSYPVSRLAHVRRSKYSVKSEGMSFRHQPGERRRGRA